MTTTYTREVGPLAFTVWPHYERAGKDHYLASAYVKCRSCGYGREQSAPTLDDYLARHAAPGVFGCRTLADPPISRRVVWDGRKGRATTLPSAR
jgi:hypothetical protein